MEEQLSLWRSTGGSRCRLSAPLPVGVGGGAAVRSLRA